MTVVVDDIPVALPVQPALLRRFTVDEYHRMIQSGVFTEDDDVELLEGWVVNKMAHEPPHDITLGLLNQAIQKRLPAGWHIRIQMPITTGDSEPEPDLVIAAGEIRRYMEGAPRPADLAVVVEVSDTTLANDRNLNRKLYARAGIACYWIVNVEERQIEVFKGPSGRVAMPDYHEKQSIAEGEQAVIVLGAQSLELPVSEILP
jgi:Uma2 family endonuclease